MRLVTIHVKHCEVGNIGVGNISEMAAVMSLGATLLAQEARGVGRRP